MLTRGLRQWASIKRRELAALLEQGYAIVSVTSTTSSDIAVALVVTLQAPIRDPANAT